MPLASLLLAASLSAQAAGRPCPFGTLDFHGLMKKAWSDGAPQGRLDILQALVKSPSARARMLETPEASDGYRHAFMLIIETDGSGKPIPTGAVVLRMRMARTYMKRWMVATDLDGRVRSGLVAKDGDLDASGTHFTTLAAGDPRLETMLDEELSFWCAPRTKGSRKR